MTDRHASARAHGRPFRRWVGAAFLTLVVTGCVTPSHDWDRTSVSAHAGERMGIGLRQLEPLQEGDVVLPNGASLADGLTEEEAALIALWNNAAYQEQLADLGVARGDLVQAGLLPNPEVVYFFPVSGKAFKYALELPIEAFWLRPIRVEAAGRELERVREQLTQAALDLIRDVRQAYAAVLLAKGRLRVGEEAVRLREQIAKAAEARLRAGDISAQEATTARIDALQAQQDAVRLRHDVALAEERLRNLLGVGADRTPLSLDNAPPPLRADLDVEQLIAEAVATRPDALAAEQNEAAAAERVRLARIGWVRFLGLADATSGQRTGHELGPAFRVTLPIWNWNQGNIHRAEAEWARAEGQRRTVHDRIMLDVRLAHVRYAQARAELQILEEKVRPEVDAAIRRAEAAYREGHAPYVVVLETTRQLLDALLRREQLQAELRQAWAELERSVGRRLDTSPPTGQTQ